MTVKYTNDARTALASDITAIATSLPVLSSAGFPTLADGEYTYLTITNALDTVKEIVKCTAISGNTLTVIRGAESTTALAFSSGEHVQLRITSGLLEAAIADAAGALGGGGDRVFHENGRIVTTSYTITAGANALSIGPITVEDEATITIPVSSQWTIL